jgi:hypothetical protein
MGNLFSGSPIFSQVDIPLQLYFLVELPDFYSDPNVANFEIHIRDISNCQRGPPRVS